MGLSKKELEEGIDDDDQTIKRLERKLGLKKKGGYEDDDILGLGQGLSDVDWGALVGANEGDKDDKDEEDEEDEDEGVDDDDEMDIDEDMDDFDDDEDQEVEDEEDEDEEEQNEV